MTDAGRELRALVLVEPDGVAVPAEVEVHFAVGLAPEAPLVPSGRGSSGRHGRRHGVRAGYRPGRGAATLCNTFAHVQPLLPRRRRQRDRLHVQRAGARAHPQALQHRAHAGGARGARERGRRARGGDAALGAGALLGEGPRDRQPDDQRPQRDGRRRSPRSATRSAAAAASSPPRASSSGRASRGTSSPTRSRRPTSPSSPSPGCGSAGTTGPGRMRPPVETFTILTTDANAAGRRRPRPHAGDPARRPRAGVAHRARPPRRRRCSRPTRGRCELRAISKLVGNPRNDVPEVLADA